MEMNLVFDLWILWCTRLENARCALRNNVATIHYREYVCAYRKALRRCEGLERAMTCN